VGCADAGATWDAWQRVAPAAAPSTLAAPLAATRDVLADVGRRTHARLAATVGVDPNAFANPCGPTLVCYLTAPAEPERLALDLTVVVAVRDPNQMQTYYNQAARRLATQMQHTTAGGLGTLTIDVFTAGPPASQPAETAAFDAARAELGRSDADAGGPLTALLGSWLWTEGMPPQLAACLTSDRLVVSTSAEEVRAALRRLPETSLAVDPEYRRVAGLTGAAGQVRMLLNVPRLLAHVRAVYPPSEAAQHALGLDDFGLCVADLTFAPAGGAAPANAAAQCDAVLAVRAEQPRGLARLLSAPSAALTLLPGTPPAPAAVLLLNTTPGAIVNEVTAMLTAVAPDAATRLSASITACDLGGPAPVDLRAALLTPPQPPLAAWLMWGRAADEPALRLVATCGLSDRAPLDGLLRTLPLHARPFGDLADLYEPAVLPLTVAVSAEHVWLGTTRDVEAALRAFMAATPTAGHPLARLLPEQATLFAYVDGRQLAAACQRLAAERGRVLAAADPLALLALLLSGAAEAPSSGVPAVVPGAGETYAIALWATPGTIRARWTLLPTTPIIAPTTAPAAPAPRAP
jgi:hypothetical protein